MVSIRKEGSYPIIGLALCATLLSIISSIYPSAPLNYVVLLNWVLVVLVINFFRDPDRAVPPDPFAIIAPADGKIIDISPLREENYLHSHATRISIFMSIFDVHVNRAPVEGRIDFVDYRTGGFAAAYREDASSGNEQLLLGFQHRCCDEGGEPQLKIMIKLIAGYLARRILLWKTLGDAVTQGERIAMIKFGSRVEVYLPPQWQILVKKGERVRAGETMIGRLKTG
jgi:phosphatidylserine decarboxylase